MADRQLSSNVGRLATMLGVTMACLLALTLAGDGELAPAQAQVETDWPTIDLVPSDWGAHWPVEITHAADGSNRLFVVQRDGIVFVVRDGLRVDPPFLDVGHLLGLHSWEQGLLGLAFPPGFAANQYFFIYHTLPSDDTVIARYRIDPANPDRADPNSRREVLRFDQPTSIHNGGQLAFGPDGYLYVSLGDGGVFHDPERFAQDPGRLLGKLLRLDVEMGQQPILVTESAPHNLFLPAVVGAGPFYTVPPSNPFTNTQGYLGEIWAMGLRNPWRFSFDRATGDLYLGDVGDGRAEEVNYQPASSTGGENYGWPIMEGSSCTNWHPCEPAGLVLPVSEYPHIDGDCAVIGGRVYRGSDFPSLQGIYLYADFCSGRIWGMRPVGQSWEIELLLDSSIRISAFGEDERGELYVAHYPGREISRIVVPSLSSRP